jgi:hypothetical protein
MLKSPLCRRTLAYFMNDCNFVGAQTAAYRFTVITCFRTQVFPVPLDQIEDLTLIDVPEIESNATWAKFLATLACDSSGFISLFESLFSGSRCDVTAVVIRSTLSDRPRQIPPGRVD